MVFTKIIYFLNNLFTSINKQRKSQEFLFGNIKYINKELSNFIYL